MNPKKQNIRICNRTTFYSIFNMSSCRKPEIQNGCLNSPKSSEFAKKTVVKNPILCLFHHVLTTIQLIFKNREIKNIKCSASVGIRPGF